MAFNSLGQQGLSVSAFLCPVCLVSSVSPRECVPHVILIIYFINLSVLAAGRHSRSLVVAPLLLHTLPSYVGK